MAPRIPGILSQVRDSGGKIALRSALRRPALVWVELAASWVWG